MKGTMKFEAPGDGNLTIHTELEHISMLDKAKLVAGMFRVLNIDITDPAEAALIYCLAAEAEKKASITKIEKTEPATGQKGKT
jgi:hypothetical protein